MFLVLYYVRVDNVFILFLYLGGVLKGTVACTFFDWLNVTPLNLVMHNNNFRHDLMTTKYQTKLEKGKIKDFHNPDAGIFNVLMAARKWQSLKGTRY